MALPSASGQQPATAGATAKMAWRMAGFMAVAILAVRDAQRREERKRWTAVGQANISGCRSSAAGSGDFGSGWDGAVRCQYESGISGRPVGPIT